MDLIFSVGILFPYYNFLIDFYKNFSSFIDEVIGIKNGEQSGFFQDESIVTKEIYLIQLSGCFYSQPHLRN